MYIGDPRGGKFTSRKTTLLKKGAFVRLAFQKSTFGKAYLPQHSTEIFKITSVKRGQPVIVYEIEDWAGEPVRGTFYHQELIEVIPPEYFPSRVKRTKTNKKTGKKEYLITFPGWPEKFDEWVTSEAFK